VKSIYIGNVQWKPKSSRELPYLFGSVDKAMAFAEITGHCVFAAFPGNPSVYRFWPGGRIEKWSGGKPEKSIERVKP
jgi:hypothetical protein